MKLNAKYKEWGSMRENYLLLLTFIVSYFKRRVDFRIFFCMLVAVLRVITLTHLPSFTELAESKKA